MRIAFIGNFSVDYSTESHRAKSFEKLGHTVLKLQENLTKAEDLIEMIEEVDVLFYSHTHDPSYVIKDLISVFEEYKKVGIPTVSVHLDRWLGLKRVSDIGKEATWFTEYIFMADGSPEAADIYNRLGLNWKFLKPGVYEDECYMAKPDYNKYPHEIVFVGSKGYHPEYPFRQKLIEFLHKTYGNKFAHYGNDGIRVLRGKDLNVMYASAKIAVGDSCFGGRPFYVSDRYYETRGRGGFLIHPSTKGFDPYGVGFYKKESLESLKKTIDSFLSQKDLAERLRQMGFEHVKKNETYTQRAQEMLDILFSKKQP